LLAGGSGYKKPQSGYPFVVFCAATVFAPVKCFVFSLSGEKTVSYK
jgi:hypothetical protein